MQAPYETILVMQDNAEKTKRAAANVAGYLERASNAARTPSPVEGTMTMSITVSITWLSDLLDFAFAEGESDV